MQSHGIVVGFEYRACPRMEFQDIVEEFDLSFQLADARTRSLTWDCDDIALIERDYLRVALGWLPPDDDDGSWHLVAAVGPSDQAGKALIDGGSLGFVADQIVDRTQEFLPAHAVLHGPASRAVGPELIDDVFDLLRLSAQTPCDTAAPQNSSAHTPPKPKPEHPWSFTPTPDGDEIEISTDTAQAAPLTQWLTARAEPSQPLRLTIHTLALTLMLHVPALGAFLFVYSMLRDVVPVST